MARVIQKVDIVLYDIESKANWDASLLQSPERVIFQKLFSERIIIVILFIIILFSNGCEE